MEFPCVLLSIFWDQIVKSAKSTEIIESIYKMSEVDVKYQLAENTHTPPYILLELLEENNPIVTRKIIANPNTPISKLESLFENEKYNRFHIDFARNPKLPPKLLVQIAKHKPLIYKILVAKNKNAPVDLLVNLGGSHRKEVLTAVCKNPNTPIKTVLKIRDRTSDPKLHSIISQRMKTADPTELETPSEEELIQQITRATPSGKEALDYNNVQVRLSIVEIPNISEKVLELLANDPSVKVRKKVASHPNTPVPILRELARECAPRKDESPGNAVIILRKSDTRTFDDIGMRLKLAINERTPRDVLENMMKGTDFFGIIQNEIARNPNTPLNIREHLMNFLFPDSVFRGIDQQVNEKDMNQFANDVDPDRRRKAALFTNSETLLKQLSKDRDDDVRSAVAGRDNLSVEFMQDQIDIQIEALLKEYYRNRIEFRKNQK